ncbi:hypothetical protein ZOSMA_77G00950 [Zostera marina]|uniref:Uncharacterized protein n=1 Tax=Zostera marina TaxID=29655 RepID=A0A0K9NP91_ZOSMR|nr:hypothetical protein ZOSMA_77G00950 [Zostera marina]
MDQTADWNRRRRLNRRGEEGSLMTRIVSGVFEFVRMAEFEIMFFLFFFIAFLIFKDLTSRPDYNQILVKKPGKQKFFPFG